MYTTIQQALVAAMKNHDKERLNVIKMVKAAVDKERIDKKCEITDELVIDVLSKQVKLREDSIGEFAKANRSDLEEAAKREIAILQEYLPAPLTGAEVDAIIATAIQEVNPTGIRDMGKIMSIVSPQVKGRYDMKVVSSKIKEKLS